MKTEKDFYHLTFILKALKIEEDGMSANASGKIGPFYYWTKAELNRWAADIATDRLNCWYGCAVLRLKREFIPEGWDPKAVDAYGPLDALGFSKKWLSGDAFVHENTFDIEVDGDNKSA